MEQQSHPQNYSESPVPMTNPGKQGTSLGQKIVKFAPIVLILILGGLSAVLGYEYYNLKQDYDPQATEFQEIIDETKALIKIADDEEVRVAKITNIEELKTQNEQFYKNASNDQYLVVLPETQRVLIYDNIEKKIVNFSSYNITVDLIPEDEIAETEKPLDIEIRTQSDVEDGVVDEIISQLTALSANYNVSTTSTTNNEYVGLTLILLNRETKPGMSQNITAHVGTNAIAEIMPEGEPDSQADVVLFIGSDVKKVTE